MFALLVWLRLVLVAVCCGIGCCVGLHLQFVYWVCLLWWLVCFCFGWVEIALLCSDGALLDVCFWYLIFGTFGLFVVVLVVVFLFVVCCLLVVLVIVLFGFLLLLLCVMWFGCLVVLVGYFFVYCFISRLFAGLFGCLPFLFA